MINIVREQFLKLTKSDLNKSIFSGYALFFLNNVVALFLTPYMLKFVTKEEYGLYILCVDFLAWVSFLEFGTSKVVESRTGHLIASGDEYGILKMFNTSLFFQTIIGIIIIPIFYFSVKLGVSNNGVKHLNLIVLLFSISAGLSVLRNLFSAIIIASGKIYLDNSIQLFINILNYALIVALTPFIGGLGLALISLSMVVLMLFRSKFRIKKLYPYLITSSNHFDKIELKKIFSHGFFFSIGSISTVLITKIDTFFLGKYSGLELITSYYVTIKLFLLVQKLVQILYNNYRPYISQFYGKGNFEAIRNFYNISTWFLFGIATFMIGIALFINNRFVTLWVGKELLMDNKFPLLFAFYVLIDLYTLPSRTILVSSLFEIRNHSFARIFEGVSRIILISFLNKYFDENILPFSSVICGFLFGNFFFYHQVNRYFKINGGILPERFIFLIVFNLLSMLSLLYLNLFNLIPLILIIESLLILGYTFKYEYVKFLDLKQLFYQSKHV
jgi:O-antigen/teichoic acid export membrane protein